MTPSPSKLHRPFTVTLLALAGLLLAAWNVFRAITAAQKFDLMQENGVGTVAVLLFVIGTAWAIGFAVAAFGLWRLRAWGRHWMLIAIVAYEINFWIARLTLERTAYEPLTRPADAIVTLLIVFGVWGLLFWPGTRRAFQALDRAQGIDTQQPAGSHSSHG